MKKFDFKKLALMGITGGVMIASQSAIQAEEATDHLIAAMGCGGKQGCGGNRGYSAPSTYSNNSQSTQQGCASQTPISYNRGSQQGCASQTPISYNNRPQNSCSSSPTSYRSQGNSGYETAQGKGSYGYQGGYQQNAPYGQPSGNQTSQSYQLNQQRPIQQPSQSGQQQPQQYSQTSWGNQNYNEPSSMRDPHPSLYHNETAYEDVQSQGHRSNVGGNNSQSRGSNQGQQQQQQQQGRNQSKWFTADSGKVAAHKLTEAELVSQLNEQGKAQFNTLDAEGKALALQLANAECKGKNSCKGLGGCANDQHSCAGKNSCAGQSSCKFTDKNKAVKVAAMKMAEKRSKLNAR